jgi:uncharacterized protein (TIGR00290 family)
MSEPIIMCWSGGKDSALALAELTADPRYEVVSLLTTVTSEYERISMHGVRRSLLQDQAEAIGLPLVEVEIPPRASNADYESAMKETLLTFQQDGVRRAAFGDLFLTDIREYRERQMALIDMECLFPVWGRDTRQLASDFVADGFRAVLCCVDPNQLDPAFCGRKIDDTFLDELPDGCDHCGENGEFHTFVSDGPVFRRPVLFERGEIVYRDGFWYCDLLPPAVVPAIR